MLTISFYSNFMKSMRKMFLLAITICLFLAGCGSGDSSNTDPTSIPYSNYKKAVESVFFEIPSSITGTDTTVTKKITGTTKAEATSTPGGIIGPSFPWQILHSFSREVAGYQKGIINVNKELTLLFFNDLRIFDNPGKSYTTDFTFENSTWTAALTAFNDSANGYDWKVIMGDPNAPDKVWMVFRFTINDEITKGSLNMDSDGEDEETHYVFDDGDTIDTLEIICEKFMQINFTKTADKSTIQWREIPKPVSLSTMINNLKLSGNSKFTDNLNDKIIKAGSTTEKGVGPGFTEVTFTKTDTHCAMAVMFYFPLYKEFPNLSSIPKTSGDEICTWTFRGMAILATNRSKVDFAYPYYNSTTIDWSNLHTVYERILKSSSIPWYPYVTNSALFEGTNHFIGFINSSGFSEYDSSTKSLKTPVSTTPSSIQDIADLRLDDIQVPSPDEVKKMKIALE